MQVKCHRFHQIDYLFVGIKKTGIKDTPDDRLHYWLHLSQVPRYKINVTAFIVIQFIGIPSSVRVDHSLMIVNYILRFHFIHILFNKSLIFTGLISQRFVVSHYIIHWGENPHFSVNLCKLTNFRLPSALSASSLSKETISPEFFESLPQHVSF